MNSSTRSGNVCCIITSNVSLNETINCSLLFIAYWPTLISSLWSVYIGPGCLPLKIAYNKMVNNYCSNNKDLLSNGKF